jgi:pimeloyl-ACP methyl ester carboxylesterase
MSDRYRPVRASRSRFVDARGLRHHVRCWGEDVGRPLVMLHGWMDASASFQFVVDALGAERRVLAPDWRGFGLTGRPLADSYWFPDYLADLDALLDSIWPGGAVDLVAHSMGGNVAMIYAGLRPARVRRLVNLEGYGLPGTTPVQAPGRMQRWLDELREPATARRYPSLEALAERLASTNPRLPIDKARWLADHTSAPVDDGRRVPLGDPVHRRVNPYLYRVDETIEIWRGIAAPVLLVESADALSDPQRAWIREPEYAVRLGVVRDLRRVRIEQAGHMLHHDQPDVVAALIEEFIDG